MKIHGIPIALVTAALWLTATLASAQIIVLHSFTGGTDGDHPAGSLAIAGGNLYGLTPYGGSSDMGTLFKSATDGSSYTLLRQGTATDLTEPWGSLAADGSLLYATTRYGGANSAGTIFQLGADGNGFTSAHDFSGGTTDGGEVWSELTLSGATLYGMSSTGGTANGGTIFRIGSDGSGFALLHSFAGGVSDGAAPLGALTLAGTTLFGMTSHGGSGNYGTLFQINTDGSSHTLLHHFTGGPGDGAQPWGSLTAVNSVLYGMTLYGGSFGNGSLFRINSDGTGYTILHSFSGSAADGAKPYGSLTPVGASLYGMTSAGGSANAGTIFKINVDGDGFAIVHDFTGGADGADPRGSLTHGGAVLYGMTRAGGAQDRGVIFFLPLPTSGARNSQLYSLLEGAAIRTGRNRP